MRYFKKNRCFDISLLSFSLFWGKIDATPDTINEEKALGLYMKVTNHSPYYIQTLGVGFMKFPATYAAAFSLDDRLLYPIIPGRDEEEDAAQIAYTISQQEPIIDGTVFENLAPRDCQKTLIDLADWQTPLYFWLAPSTVYGELRSGVSFTCEDFLPTESPSDSAHKTRPSTLSFSTDAPYSNLFLLRPRTKASCRRFRFPANSPT